MTVDDADGVALAVVVKIVCEVNVVWVVFVIVLVPAKDVVVGLAGVVDVGVDDVVFVKGVVLLEVALTLVVVVSGGLTSPCVVMSVSGMVILVVSASGILSVVVDIVVVDPLIGKLN